MAKKTLSKSPLKAETKQNQVLVRIGLDETTARDLARLAAETMIIAMCNVLAYSSDEEKLKFKAARDAAIDILCAP